ncbi:cystathionine beta-lyase [Salinisphaera shabanensis T35B1]|uniref:cystathionine beta-lyase n=1 Tax=Salinisphaera shabanensis TaxID=180542 RepID=UPI00334139C4
MKTATRLVHAGRNPAAQQGMVNPPVYHASTVLFESLDALERAAANPFEGVYYGRNGTPVQFAFEDAVAEMEGAFGAVTTCSGLAAITAALMSEAAQGAHFLVTDNVYGPTRKLCDGLLKQLGVTTEYFDPTISAEALESRITDATRVLFVEAPGSLTFEISDIPALAEAAHRHDVTVIADNTWATPLYFNAFDHGVDISIHAATKYLVGHADAMLGVINCNETHYMNVRKTTAGMGYCAGPDDIYLGLRGLRTLGQRLPTHQANAIALADWLAEQPEVARVIHPARADHPQHALFARDFSGASGLFSVVLEPVARDRLAAMLDHLELFGMGFSWGGYESLILSVDPNRSRTATRWEHDGPTLRIHAGLEAVDDLIDDLAAGLKRLRA